ncbi:flavin reductase family protein [Vibrio sp. SCSIO 43136]|uniref:flavin reductase family protein n=1 Tax=Vibrio sp. SCSIO 43136 TaxID=2819101 RepID=UPI0020760D16|nr:flavin reductase family protein [Vibrio sp. SCSIO 43136]USD63988.1 flavin reductase family protein [Vibrio sp. SCSIO 43136]
MNIDLTTLSSTEIYHLMTQTVIPRPVAWVLTETSPKSYNLAPFSYFAAVSSQPPMLMFSVGKKPSGELKDTIANLKNGSKMTIHIASTDLAQQVTDSSATLEHSESEVTKLGLETVDWPAHGLPRLSACNIAFGCSLHEIQSLGDVPQQLVFAKIEQVFIDESVIEQNPQRLVVDAEQVDPLARLGGTQYASLSAPFSIARPK